MAAIERAENFLRTIAVNYAEEGKASAANIALEIANGLAEAVPPVPAEVGELVGNIREWRKLRGEGMISAVGEYTPKEFWDLCDVVERQAALLERYAAALVEIAAKTDVNCDEAPTVARTALQTNP